MTIKVEVVKVVPVKVRKNEAKKWDCDVNVRYYFSRTNNKAYNLVRLQVRVNLGLSPEPFLFTNLHDPTKQIQIGLLPKGWRNEVYEELKKHHLLRIHFLF